MMTAVLLTTFSLIAFAANSLLCRMALGDGLIDPISFTTIRLTSGALTLLILSQILNNSQAKQKTKSSFSSGLALFAYATAFSLAYITLSTGTGALILFGAVQITMFAAGLKQGENLRIAQWLGSITALGGLVYLVLPGLQAPDPFGAGLMAISGIAWGIYSIRGRNVSFPIQMTTGNFLKATPLTLLFSLVTISSIHLQTRGIILALISGIITSGLGYVIWYKALKGLTTTQASVVQLIVPILASFAGVVFLSEIITVRLLSASALILGGVALAVIKRNKKVIVV